MISRARRGKQIRQLTLKTSNILPRSNEFIRSLRTQRTNEFVTTCQDAKNETSLLRNAIEVHQRRCLCSVLELEACVRAGLVLFQFIDAFVPVRCAFTLDTSQECLGLGFHDLLLPGAF